MSLAREGEGETGADLCGLMLILCPDTKLPPAFLPSPSSAPLSPASLIPIPFLLPFSALSPSSPASPSPPSRYSSSPDFLPLSLQVKPPSPLVSLTQTRRETLAPASVGVGGPVAGAVLTSPLPLAATARAGAAPTS